MPRLSIKAAASHNSRRFSHPKIELWPVNKIHRPKRHARTHSKKQMEKLRAVIRRVGFINPIVIDENGVALAGILRLTIAESEGDEVIPVIQIKHLTDLEKRAYALAENRIALEAGWDHELLAVELGELSVALPEAQIDFGLTGFDVTEADLLIADHSEPHNSPADELPEKGPPSTVLNDVWAMAGHRLVCGDATNPATYRSLMQGDMASMGFTDPPYNVSISRHARGNGTTNFDEFPMASGEMSTAEYERFVGWFMGLMSKACVSGAILYVCIDWRHVATLVEVGVPIFGELKNICVWVKANGGLGSLYRSHYEMVCVFKNGSAPHINNVELGQHGRSRTNVWNYPGMNSFKAGRQDELEMHPTVKPARLVANAMLDCSRRHSIVLDPFIGSGTTIIAGEIVGRRVYGIELDPQYVDVAVRRWQRFSGRDAILEATGQTFSEVAASRSWDTAGETSTKRANRINK